MSLKTVVSPSLRKLLTPQAISLNGFKSFNVTTFNNQNSGR